MQFVSNYRDRVILSVSYIVIHDVCIKRFFFSRNGNNVLMNNVVNLW